MTTILPFPPSPPQARLRLAARNDRPAAFPEMQPSPMAGRACRVKATGEPGVIVGWLPSARYVVRIGGERRSYRPNEVIVGGPEGEAA